jgi:ribonuclease G
MSNDLIINARPHEIRVAQVENGVVVELHIERKTGQELMGNIYRGRIVRVLPGMQAAFVDIGLDRSAFLYVTDVHHDVLDLEQIMLSRSVNNHSESATEENLEALPETGRPPVPFKIEDLLREGQDVMVQVAKEPMGTKGARLTCHISLPGRHLVLMPNVDHVGVSRRIEDVEERERLRSLAQEIKHDRLGLIVRTASEGEDRYKLKSELDFLIKLWGTIQKRMTKVSGTGLLYKDLGICLRSVRDLFTREVDRLVIDSREEYNKVMEFIETFAPGLKYSVELYEGDDPIFDFHGIEMEISRALDKKIWLKSGGSIVIELTEALTAIDVNTGSYVGARNLEETILKTNLEAVKEIAYQLRLRNLGGLIVIDFIDMDKKANRERVFTALKEALGKDKAKTHILKMSELGLIEMTRKRTRENLNRLLTEPCLYCEGRGSLKSRKTICYELLRDVEREARALANVDAILVNVHPEIARVLKEEAQESIVDLERRINRRITIFENEGLHVEQYEIKT